MTAPGRRWRSADLPARAVKELLQVLVKAGKPSCQGPKEPRLELRPGEGKDESWQRRCAGAGIKGVGRLLQRLVPVARHVLVHVDEKRPDYLQSLEESVGRLGLGDKVSLRSKYRVNRGGVSTLTAWLWGMSWLLQNVEGWDYFINLNDSDYPVAELSSLQRFLWLNNGSNFVNVGSAYKDCDCGRYLVYECRDELYSIAPETRYPRRPELQHASGPNLVAITWAFASYIDTNRGVALTPVQQVLEDLSILQQPDEKFFQTMSLNSPFCQRHVRWGFHIWDRPRLAPDTSSPEVAGPELKMLTPPVLNESFWPVLSEVKSKGMAVFFARKFDNNQTRSLQDRIDAAVDRRSTDFGSGPRWLAVKGASSRAWLKALFHADALASPERLEVWEEQPRDGVYFGLQRYRASATVPCTDLLQESRLARRRCSATGQAVLEELAFRPIEDAMNLSAVSRSPLLAALRVGTGWSPEHFSLHMASCNPAATIRYSARSSAELAWGSLDLPTPGHRSSALRGEAMNLFRCVESDTLSFSMLHFVLAIALAATSIGLLTGAGVLNRCPICVGGGEYSTCAATQDFKVLASFLLGAVTCKMVEGQGSQRQADRCDSRGSSCCWLLW
eukprot:s3343_g5.t1